MDRSLIHKVLAHFVTAKRLGDHITLRNLQKRSGIDRHKVASALDYLVEEGILRRKNWRWSSAELTEKGEKKVRALVRKDGLFGRFTVVLDADEARLFAELVTAELVGYKAFSISPPPALTSLHEKANRLVVRVVEDEDISALTELPEKYER